MQKNADTGLVTTETVGYKFSSEGGFLPFRGATLVSPLYPTHPAFTLLREVRREAQQACYGHKYVFLPDSSFHMTVKVLYNDHSSDRTAESWSPLIPNTAPCAVIDRFLYQRLRRIRFPVSLRMRVVEMRDNSLRLEPADQDTAATLTQFRDAVAERTGIRHLDHDSYQHHLSYAYRLWELLPEEKGEQNELLERQLRRWQEHCPVFDLPGPYLSAFPDMSNFPIYQPEGDRLC